MKRQEFDVHGLKIKAVLGGYRLVSTGRVYRYKRDAINAALNVRFPYRFTGSPIKTQAAPA